MNKREKAVWKLVTILGVFMIMYFTYTSIQDFNKLNRNINGSENVKGESKKNMGMTDYINEFEKYPGSLDAKHITQKKMLNVIESYGLNSRKILKETQKGYRNTETKMYKHGFIETYSNSKTKTKNSSVYGFSLIDSSITKGEFFLTEIKGSVSSSCNGDVLLKNVYLKENDSTIGSPLISFKSSNQYSCDNKKDIDGNKLCLKNNGEIWYSFDERVYGFEFNMNIKGGNGYFFSDQILANYHILKNETGRTIGIPKHDSFINRGVGLFLKFSEPKTDYDINDINFYNKGNLYDKNFLNTFVYDDEDLMNHANYFYNKLNDDGNLEIYLSINNEFDEYAFEVTCFKCDININERNLNELEIIRAKIKERNFYFELETNDPSDLTNIVIFDGQDGYNQGKRLRAVVPTNITIDQSGFGNPIGLAEYQGQTYTVTLGDTVGGYKILKMNQKYFLGKNLQSSNIDTLRYKK